MMKVFFLILLFLPGKVCAQDAEGLCDHAIAGTVKILAKIFVQTTNIDKAKTKQIKALSNMKEEKFQKRYTEIYIVLKDVPLELRAHYGVTEHMTKEEVIQKIRHIDKSDLKQIINKIPDRVIVKYIKNCLRQKAYQSKDKTLLQKINSLWKKLISKA